jgi:hypothetical protein
MRKGSTNFLPYVTSIGGLLSYEFLYNLRSEDPKIDYVAPEDFKALDGSHPLSKRELGEQITDAWDTLLERWDAISLSYEKMELSEARTKWILPLLECLGFDLQYNKQNVTVGEDERLSFHLSHKGFNDPNAPYLNCVAPSQKLEETDSVENSDNRRKHKRSPHDELQSFLNITKGCKWGIVTNGIAFRVLRQFYHTTTKAYIEFDLENIFRSRSFSDFRLLYRTTHVSRFLLFDKKATDDKINQSCILEEFYEQSKAAGVSAGEDLRKNVKIAIESLANGFLTADLSRKMADDENLCKSYYAEILRVIYRMIFLLFAEQRGMLPTRGSLYAEEYSMNRLREIAIQSKGQDNHTDLWEGLKVTFKLLKQGCPDPQIGVFAYNGTLFDDLEMPILSELSCKNSDLCVAVRQLTSIERGNVSNRINYLDLGVEEIGSIYESLLDYTPRIARIKEEVDGKSVFPNMFYLDPRGASRKTTGSYYTDRRLIDELIHSALEPVVKDRLSKATDKESALLSIKVCDPACGSGAFLIAANNFLARELSKLRNPDQIEPSEKEMRKARREVLQHCIYGVDVNPMAVELTKVSLWINASVENVPLNFLDHHVKCGNSLIGANPGLIEKGIPSTAFTPVTSDDPVVAKKIQKINISFPESARLEDFMIEIGSTLRSKLEELTNYSETDVLEVEEKKRKYANVISSQMYRNQKFLADAWTSAFFWQHSNNSVQAPTTSTIRSIQKLGRMAIEDRQSKEIQELSKRYHFFHWDLEFPEVFGRDSKGFDCILGNPPWEKIKIQEREFFESRNLAIATAANAAQRKSLIKKLASTEPRLWAEYEDSIRASECEGKFFRSSGRFRLTSSGDINTYALFAEHIANSLNQKGLAGIIVPTGISTDDTNREFFTDLIESNRLISLFDFQNKEGLFPGVHRSYKFSLLTMGNLKKSGSFVFDFFLTKPEQLYDQERRILFDKEDFSVLNPNTKTACIFRSKRDAVITKEIYKRFPILMKDDPYSNPWNVKYFTMFHMTQDSSFFSNKDELEKNGFVLRGNIFYKDNDIYLPLYEGKMIWQYNHRAASIEYKGQVVQGRHDVKPSTQSELSDPSFVPLPRFWVNRRDVLNRLSCEKGWLCGFRDITNSDSDRTSIFSVIPFTATSNKLPLLLIGSEAKDASLLIANANSIPFDYIVRQKLGGNTFNLFILKQLPVVPHADYSQEVAKIIRSRVLELTYVSNDLECFAKEMGYVNENGEVKPPFRWDEYRRLLIRSELDAIYFLLYGIPRNEAEYVLDTFVALKKSEIRLWGEYKSKNLVLNYYDLYSDRIPVQVRII